MQRQCWMVAMTMIRLLGRMAPVQDGVVLVMEACTRTARHQATVVAMAALLAPMRQPVELLEPLPINRSRNSALASLLPRDACQCSRLSSDRPG